MKTLARLIAALLRPAIIFPIPKGMTPDATAMDGLFGLMQNSNNYAEALASVATAGTNVTLIPAQLLSGVVQLNSGNSGPFTVTLPSTGSIISNLGNTTPLDGSYFERWTFINNSGQPAVLTAGDGGTAIVGTALIASTVARTYIMQVLGSSTISVTNAGQLSL